MIKIIDRKPSRLPEIEYFKVSETFLFGMFENLYWIRVDIQSRNSFRGVKENGDVFSYYTSEFDPTSISAHGENKSYALEVIFAIDNFRKIAGLNNKDNRVRRFWDYV